LSHRWRQRRYGNENPEKGSIEAITTQVTKGKNAMPAFAGRLKPEQIEDVATYVLEQSEKDWKG
jgi:cytochrome c6